MLLASLGVYVVIENLVSAVFGDQTQSIRSGQVLPGIPLLGARITTVQLGIILANCIAVAGLLWLVHSTRLGKAMRAVASDPELACVSGIDQDRVLAWTFSLASLLAGGAGILTALDVDMIPTMGMPLLIMGVVAAIIGGTSSICGVIMGAFFLALTQQFGALVLSTEWQDAVAFVILLTFLFFRPGGFMGKRTRTATV